MPVCLEQSGLLLTPLCGCPPGLSCVASAAMVPCLPCLLALCCTRQGCAHCIEREEDHVIDAAPFARFSRYLDL